MYEENELLFGDGDEPFDDDNDDDFENADGGANPYQMAVYGADGNPVNTGIVKAMPPVNRDLRNMKRQQQPVQRNRKPEPGKYIKISIENTGDKELSCYLFATSDEQGLIKATGTPFAGIGETGTDAHLVVNYFDENVASFIQQHRSGKVSYVPFLRMVCSEPTISLSSYSIVVDQLLPGQSEYSKYLAIHGMGYSSERNQVSNELTFNLEKKNQGFYIGGNFRPKITIPKRSEISLMIHMGESLDLTRAYTDGRI